MVLMSFSSSLKAVKKPLRNMLPDPDPTLTENPTATAQAAYAKLQDALGIRSSNVMFQCQNNAPASLLKAPVH